MALGTPVDMKYSSPGTRSEARSENTAWAPSRPAPRPPPQALRRTLTSGSPQGEASGLLWPSRARGFCSTGSLAAASLPGPAQALTSASHLVTQPHPWSLPGFHTHGCSEDPQPSSPTNCLLGDAGTCGSLSLGILIPKRDASQHHYEASRSTQEVFQQGQLLPRLSLSPRIWVLRSP